MHAHGNVLLFQTAIDNHGYKSGFRAKVAETRIDFIPLLVEIKAEACEDEGKERHEDGDSDRTAVGGAIGLVISERDILPHTQTWKESSLLC